MFLDQRADISRWAQKEPMLFSLIIVLLLLLSLLISALVSERLFSKTLAFWVLGIFIAALKCVTKYIKRNPDAMAEFQKLTSDRITKETWKKDLLRSFVIAMVAVGIITAAIGSIALFFM